MLKVFSHMVEMLLVFLNSCIQVFVEVILRLIGTQSLACDFIIRKRIIFSCTFPEFL